MANLSVRQKVMSAPVIKNFHLIPSVTSAVVSPLLNSNTPYY